MGVMRMDQKFGDFAGVVLADAPVFFPFVPISPPSKEIGRTLSDMFINTPKSKSRSDRER
jgi:hypothetical protein